MNNNGIMRFSNTNIDFFMQEIVALTFKENFKLIFYHVKNVLHATYVIMLCKR